MGFRKRGLILALGIALAGCGQNDPGLAKTMGITKAQRAAIEDRIKPFSVVNVIGGTLLLLLLHCLAKQSMLHVEHAMVQMGAGV